MIQTQLSQTDTAARLASFRFSDDTPLRKMSGFADDSGYGGMARQSFSLLLTQHQIDVISGQVAQFYARFMQDVQATVPKGSPLPFDMARLDVFLDPKDCSLKIIEINTRNVGMHEIVEWFDTQLVDSIEGSLPLSLNQRFVSNQKQLHQSRLGSAEPLLYVSPDYIPRWLYWQELCRQFPHITSIMDGSSISVDQGKLHVDGTTYQALTRKFGGPLTPEVTALDKAGAISILQPRWMRQFGLKDYLSDLDLPTIAGSHTFAPSRMKEYVDRQQELVLKIIDAGNSRSVYVGRGLDASTWLDELTIAAERPEIWIIQDYIVPHAWTVQPHDDVARPMPIQLGIFIIPSPTGCDIDIAVKGYSGTDDGFVFDPSGYKPDIWFGNVIVTP